VVLGNEHLACQPVVVAVLVVLVPPLLGVERVALAVQARPIVSQVRLLHGPAVVAALAVPLMVPVVQVLVATVEATIRAQRIPDQVVVVARLPLETRAATAAPAS
jgi:hypothetical protein